MELSDMVDHDDVILNKIAIIERCLARIAEEYGGDGGELRQNFTKQDSIILNLQRLCEASIDIANRKLKLIDGPIPKSSRDAFQELHRAGILDQTLSISLQNMVGLRNIAVHDYQNLNLDVVEAVLEKHLNDFQTFVKAVI